jgi:hypothetical protein
VLGMYLSKLAILASYRGRGRTVLQGLRALSTRAVIKLRSSRYATNTDFGNRRQSTFKLSHKLTGKRNRPLRVRMTNIQMFASLLYKCKLLGVTWTVESVGEGWKLEIGNR